MGYNSAARLSLTVKLLFIFLSVVLITNILIGVLTYRISAKGLTESVTSHLDRVADDIGNQVASVNQRHFQSLRAIAALQFIKDESIPLAEKSRQLSEVATAMESNVQNIAFYDKDGNAITTDGRHMNFANRVYFTEAIAGRTYVSDPTYSTVTDSVLQHFSIPVYSNDGRIIGAMVTVISGNIIQETIAAIDSGGGMHPSVINYKTKVTVANVNEGTDENSFELDNNSELGVVMNHIFEGKDGVEDFFDPNIQQHMIASYKRIPGSDWTVFAVAPYDAYFGILATLRTSAISLTAAVIVISALLIMLFITMLFKPLKTVKESITTIASGNADLTQRIDESSNDEIGDVVKGFNKFTAMLQTIISDVKNSRAELSKAGNDMSSSAQNTATSIDEIIQNIKNMSGQIHNQVTSVSQTAAAVNEIASNIESLKQMIENQASGVTEASSAVEEMIGNIESVNRSVDKMANSFSKLETDAQGGISKQQAVDNQIKQIEQQSVMLQEANAAISSIAEQTNLLAMNAAIEAAHAGEAGKGFAVVADEIRKLSETSSQQSKTIGDQLKNIQDSIAAVVNASADSSHAFASVSSQITETDQLVSLIKAAMEEQKTGSQQITATLHNMNDSTIEVRNAAAEMNEGNKAILLEIGRLQDSTATMQSGIDTMAVGAEKIDKTGAVLETISQQVKASIDKISAQIDQFKV